MKRAALLLLTVAGCASPGVPPGGPERHTPPMITRIDPDTNTVNVRGGEFIVHFDEVINERPAAAPTLGDLVLVSPRDGQPDVAWHRNAISVRPRNGWRRNTAYTVTILPGISDLRGNVRSAVTEVTFSTGPNIPGTKLVGTVFDWVTGKPASPGFVELTPVADTTYAYVAATDSLGAYHLRGVPPGQYRVRGFIDQNRNHGVDPGEAFDTTRVNLADSLSLELLAFAHDSAGPQLSNVAATDSVTIHAYFNTPVDPRTPLTAAQFTLRGADSVAIPIRSVTASVPDTIVPPTSPAASAVPLPPATPARATVPRPARPLLVRDIVIVIAGRLRSAATYALSVRDAIGPTGKRATSTRAFTVPNYARPADSLPPRPTTPQSGATTVPRPGTPRLR